MVVRNRVLALPDQTQVLTRYPQHSSPYTDVLFPDEGFGGNIPDLTVCLGSWQFPYMYIYIHVYTA